MKSRVLILLVGLSSLLSVSATVALAEPEAAKTVVRDDYWDNSSGETLYSPDNDFRQLTDSDFDLQKGVPHEKFKGISLYKLGADHRCPPCRKQTATFSSMATQRLGIAFSAVDVDENYGVSSALLEGGGIPQIAIFIDGERAAYPSGIKVDNSGHVIGAEGKYITNFHGYQTEAEIRELIPFMKKVSEIDLNDMNQEVTRVAAEKIHAEKAKLEAMHHAPKPILAEVTDETFSNRVLKTQGVSIVAFVKKQGEDRRSDELRDLLSKMAADTSGSPRWGYYFADASSNASLLAQFNGYFRTDKTTKARDYLSPVMAVFFDGKLAMVPYETKNKDSGVVETQYFMNILPLDFSQDPAAKLIAKVKGAKTVFDAPAEE